MLINSWGWWIGDDTFLYRNGECLDMDGIDIRTTPRKIALDSAFLGTYWTSTQSWLWVTLNYVTDTIDWLIQSYSNSCFFDWGNPWLVAWADMHITVGSNFSDYNASTNPEWVRTFFFTYDNSTNPIKSVGYSWGLRAVLATINTSWGTSPANIPANLRTTAVCYLWKGAIIFARGSKIYEFNPETSTLVGVKIELPVGAVVKYLTYQWGLINIVYTINNDTFIHSATYDGTSYKLYPYSNIQKWEKAISCANNGNSIYFLSTNWIFQYSGTIQMVKKVAFTINAVCAYNKWVLRIWDGTNFYEFWIQKPWYGTPLTKKSVDLDIKWVTETKIVTFQSGTNQFRYDSEQVFYKSTGTWIFHPYTAGQFWANKKGLALTIGYTLPRSSYVDSSIQCSIDVYIQTYDMYASNPTTYVNIATITDKTQVGKDILFTNIVKALWDAWYSEEFPYFRLKLVLNAWDPYSAYSNTRFRLSPEVYDVYITHKEIDKNF